MKNLFSIFSLVFLFAALTYGQAAVDIPITVSDNAGGTKVLKFGLDLTATAGIDSHLGESDLPPLPPVGVYDVRFLLASPLSTAWDYRNAPSWLHTGNVQHTLQWQFTAGGTSITIAYDLPAEATMQIIDVAGGGFWNSGVRSGTGSYTFTPPSFLTQSYLNIQYTAIGPVITAPVFSIAPASLNFGSVNVGSSSMLPATVTNTGNAPLTINNVTSSDVQFTFTPGTFPIVIPAGGDQIFNITFAPTLGGLQAASLNFTHDAAGSPTSYAVQGIGYIPAPIFGVTPPSLAFGSVEVGVTSAPQNLTVTNTGDADLEVTLTSGNAQFAVSPTTLVTIPPNGNSVFSVTFTPSATGLQNAIVTFTHNAGAPVDVPVSGTGFTTAPFFTMNPASLGFGQVSVGQSSIKPVTVTNTGNALLTISGVVSSNAHFTFAPNTFPVNIAAGANVVFNVTFTPTVAGDENGTLAFTHNATGSPAVLPVSGTGRTQGGALEFVVAERTLLDGTLDNEDAVVLRDYTGQPLKALQFDIIVGKDSAYLVFKSIERGAAILNTSLFTFDFEVYPGTTLPNGSRTDRVKVVILGIDGGELPIGVPVQEIVKFKYDVVQINGPHATTYNSLENVTGATSTPVVNAELTTGPDELININNGTPMGLLGDVNLDNEVNFLDILLMIDYILGRVTFSAEQFAMGDIAPWTIGNILPDPDGVINVLDLAVLENIVLTGLYPSGIPWNGTPITPKASQNFVIVSNGGGITPGMNAKITFFLGSKGIRVAMESVKKVKGLQMELSEINSLIPADVLISSYFSKASYYQQNSDLRILVYDSQSNPIEPGEYMVTSLPFAFNNPEDLQIARIIVADENNAAMDKIEVEIVYDVTSVPVDYMLFQNYPNPFNPSTMVRFSVPYNDFVTIKVYDMLGQEVSTLFSGQVDMGTYTVQWNGLDNYGSQMSSGTYIYRMTASGYVQSKKMILVK